jgi:hypothetical protein
MPNGIGGFGGASVTIGTDTNDDIPNVIITPSGDVLTEGGNIIHGEGGGRGQGGSGRQIILEQPPVRPIEPSNENTRNLLIGFIALKYLGVF